MPLPRIETFFHCETSQLLRVFFRFQDGLLHGHGGLVRYGFERGGHYRLPLFDRPVLGRHFAQGLAPWQRVRERTDGRSSGPVLRRTGTCSTICSTPSRKTSTGWVSQTFRSRVRTFIVNLYHFYPTFDANRSVGRESSCIFSHNVDS